MSCTETISVGNVQRVKARFIDPLDGDAPLDPTTVSVSIKDPSGAVTTYHYGQGGKITRAEEGVYYTDVSFDAPGDWYVRWHSTGTGQAAEERSFSVRQAQAVE